MKNHEKRHKEIPGTKDKKINKSKASSSDREDILCVECIHSLAADGGIPFLVNFSLKEGQIKGKITHCLTNKPLEFSGLDQNEIIKFMKGYLFRLEKSAEKMTFEEQPQPIHAPADVQLTEEARITPSGEMRTRSFGVIPAGSAQSMEILRQGQPFQLQWTFESPSMSGMEGDQLHYRIVISGKNLEGGERLKIGDTTGQIGFGSPLTAHIPSEPLPPGAYWLEADSDFSLKSNVAEWRSACRERRLIQVI